ncbi:plasmid pRiA4b ORF-3 family protein [Marinobacter halodurans]|uniref:Plasmid pRiA4b ORF-3 family protein n=1 Tax=Marinobacter halodurans TaxID=2528979 RepID=A0ABY1ZE16_9GAMM|nr:plasmid pRiA4b ORF-3 family protein [Marinobacter halodurans]TBW46883.1 plasmid pRiA4b ORF-3 family protein [Marinobacter halodurans]
MPTRSGDVYQLKVTLSGSRPPIWRRLLVESGTTLQDLHRIIQVAMGWQAAHLHQFESSDGVFFGDPDEDPDGMMNYVDETSVPLEAVLQREKQTLRYEYDFGDGWEHFVVLEKILPGSGDTPLPSCIKAVRQCPPEDVGGLGGFYEFLDVMANPAHPEHDDAREWLGGVVFDPEFVDLEAINEGMAHRERLFDPVAAPLFDADEECEGLSFNQMEQLMTSPLHCPAVFDANLDSALIEPHLDSAPIMRILKALFQELDGKGVRLTPKGNLPRRVVTPLVEAGGDAALAEPYRDGFARIRSEEDVIHVHLARLLAEIAGFTRKQRGQLLLTQRVKDWIRKEQWLPIYQELLLTAMNRFNWSWLDRFDEFDEIQVVGPFALWLLAKYGDEWRPESFYIDAMLTAFPMLTEVVPPSPFYSPEKQIAHALSLQMFSLYSWLGLIECEDKNKGGRLASLGDRDIRRTRLFEGLFRASGA